VTVQSQFECGTIKNKFLVFCLNFGLPVLSVLVQPSNFKTPKRIANKSFCCNSRKANIQVVIAKLGGRHLTPDLTMHTDFIKPIELTKYQKKTINYAIND
jgi:hypothetical protein